MTSVWCSLFGVSPENGATHHLRRIRYLPDRLILFLLPSRRDSHGVLFQIYLNSICSGMWGGTLWLEVKWTETLKNSFWFARHGIQGLSIGTISLDLCPVQCLQDTRHKILFLFIHKWLWNQFVGTQTLHISQDISVYIRLSSINRQQPLAYLMFISVIVKLYMENNLNSSSHKRLNV